MFLPCCGSGGDESMALHLQSQLCEHRVCSYGYRLSAGSWSFKIYTPDLLGPRLWKPVFMHARQVSYCWAMSPSLIPLSMPWKQLSVLRILTGMSSPASACSKEPASSETVVPLTLVFRPGSTITIFSYVSTLYKAIPVLCWWWLIVSVSWTGFGIT